MFFANLNEAEDYLEPIDVENREYVGYDREGRRLDISVDGGRVRLQMRDEDQVRSQELAELVRDFLTRCSVDVTQNDNLEQLLSRAEQFQFKPPSGPLAILGELLTDVVRGLTGRFKLRS